MSKTVAIYSINFGSYRNEIKGGIDNKLKKVIIKYSVIISLFTFVVSKFFKKAIDEIVDVFLVVIFHIDIDKNGEPDLVQLQKYNIKI